MVIGSEHSQEHKEEKVALESSTLEGLRSALQGSFSEKSSEAVRKDLARMDIRFNGLSFTDWFYKTCVDTGRKWTVKDSTLFSLKSQAMTMLEEHKKARANNARLPQYPKIPPGMDDYLASKAGRELYQAFWRAVGKKGFTQQTLELLKQVAHQTGLHGWVAGTTIMPFRSALQKKPLLAFKHPLGHSEKTSIKTTTENGQEVLELRLQQTFALKNENSKDVAKVLGHRDIVSYHHTDGKLIRVQSCQFTVNPKLKQGSNYHALAEQLAQTFTVDLQKKQTQEQEIRQRLQHVFAAVPNGALVRRDLCHALTTYGGLSFKQWFIKRYITDEQQPETEELKAIVAETKALQKKEAKASEEKKEQASAEMKHKAGTIDFSVVHRPEIKVSEKLPAYLQGQHGSAFAQQFWQAVAAKGLSKLDCVQCEGFAHQGGLAGWALSPNSAAVITLADRHHLTSQLKMQMRTRIAQGTHGGTPTLMAQQQHFFCIQDRQGRLHALGCQQVTAHYDKIGNLKKASYTFTKNPRVAKPYTTFAEALSKRFTKGAASSGVPDPEVDPENSSYLRSLRSHVTDISKQIKPLLQRDIEAGLAQHQQEQKEQTLTDKVLDYLGKKPEYATFYQHLDTYFLQQLRGRFPAQVTHDLYAKSGSSFRQLSAQLAAIIIAGVKNDNVALRRAQRQLAAVTKALPPAANNLATAANRLGAELATPACQRTLFLLGLPAKERCLNRLLDEMHSRSIFKQDAQLLKKLQALQITLSVGPAEQRKRILNQAREESDFNKFPLAAQYCLVTLAGEAWPSRKIALGAIVQEQQSQDIEKMLVAQIDQHLEKGALQQWDAEAQLKTALKIWEKWCDLNQEDVRLSPALFEQFSRIIKFKAEDKLFRLWINVLFLRQNWPEENSPSWAPAKLFGKALLHEVKNNSSIETLPLGFRALFDADEESIRNYLVLLFDSFSQGLKAQDKAQYTAQMREFCQDVFSPLVDLQKACNAIDPVLSQLLKALHRSLIHTFTQYRGTVRQKALLKTVPEFLDGVMLLYKALERKKNKRKVVLAGERLRVDSRTASVIRANLGPLIHEASRLSWSNRFTVGAGALGYAGLAGLSFLIPGVPLFAVGLLVVANLCIGAFALTKAIKRYKRRRYGEKLLDNVQQRVSPKEELAEDQNEGMFLQEFASEDKAVEQAALGCDGKEQKSDISQSVAHSGPAAIRFSGISSQELSTSTDGELSDQEQGESKQSNWLCDDELFADVKGSTESDSDMLKPKPGKDFVL